MRRLHPSLPVVASGPFQKAMYSRLLDIFSDFGKLRDVQIQTRLRHIVVAVAYLGPRLVIW